MAMLEVGAMVLANAWIGELSLTASYLTVLFLSATALLVCAGALALGPLLRRNDCGGSDVNKPKLSTSALIADKPPMVEAQKEARTDETGNEEAAKITTPRERHVELAVADRAGASEYRQIVEHIEQIVFILNPEGEIEFLSAPWERLLDYSAADCLKQALGAYIHPEDRPSVEAQIGGVLRGRRERCQMEARMIARNGTSHWFELRAHGVRDGLGSAIGTLTDIDDQKQVEASLRAVRRSLSTLLNSIPGMVYRCKANRNWSFEFASDGCLEVTGYEPYHLVNDPNFYFQNIVFPEDRDDAWNHAHQQVMLQRNFQLVYRIINRPGHIKWVWEQGRGVYSSGGELLALEGFITVVADDGAHAKAVLKQFYELINDEHVIAPSVT